MNNHIDTIGKAADQAETLLAAFELPGPWEIHRQGLEAGLSELRDTLRQVYIALSVEDPWEGAS